MINSNQIKIRLIAVIDSEKENNGEMFKFNNNNHNHMFNNIYNKINNNKYINKIINNKHKANLLP